MTMRKNMAMKNNTRNKRSATWYPVARHSNVFGSCSAVSVVAGKEGMLQPSTGRVTRAFSCNRRQNPRSWNTRRDWFMKACAGSATPDGADHTAAAFAERRDTEPQPRSASAAFVAVLPVLLAFAFAALSPACGGRAEDSLRGAGEHGTSPSPADQGAARTNSAEPDSFLGDAPELWGRIRVRFSDDARTRTGSRRYQLVTDSGTDVQLRFVD